MKMRRFGVNVVLLGVLAGCSTTSPEGTTPAVPAAGSGAAAPAVTGDKAAVCMSQGARKYGVSGDALSLSNDYPTGNGDAIDGAATLADGFRRFRCDFDRAGTFVGITDITGQA